MAIPHILVTILGFFLLYKICQRHFKTVLGFVVTFSIVCFNQYSIFHSFELRPYAVLPTLVLASCYLSDSFVSEYDRLSRNKKISIGLFYIFTIWFLSLHGCIADRAHFDDGASQRLLVFDKTVYLYSPYAGHFFRMDMGFLSVILRRQGGEFPFIALKNRAGIDVHLPHIGGF